MCVYGGKWRGEWMERVYIKKGGEWRGLIVADCGID